MRTAVIDIGSNTLLLLIAEPAPDGGLRSIVDDCRFARLGQGLDATGRLAPEAIARGLAVCRDYRAALDGAGVERLAIVGTAALREAANAADFVGPAEAILGGTIEIIAGEREAELAWRSVAVGLPEVAGRPFVVIDVGGASTEVIASDGARVTAAVSLPIGAVRLTERHLRHDPATAGEAAALVADIDARLADATIPAGATVVGTAGTATTLATLALELDGYDPARIHGVRLTAAAVEARLTALLTATVEAKRAMRGMEPKRADVVTAGVAIFARALRRAGATELVVSDRGIRWGVAYELAGLGPAAR
ncbi:MAG: Ppx/GppA family phosphatase [Myxococcales bacterium]|nr:Ppx/GppA family phosphatase [Myxococcales bacterium]